MQTVSDYLAKLPDDRRTAIAQVRDVINANLPTGYEERLQFGMISWCVPESVLPAKQVYNKQPLCFASLGSQKNHMAVYLMCVYGDDSLRTWFEKAYKQSGKKLDMGKSCVRFQTVDALPLDVIGEAVAKVSVDNYVAIYRRTRGAHEPVSRATIKKSAAKKSATKKPAAKKSAAKKSAAKKSAAKKSATKKSATKKR
jgi:hypothetical protein